MNLPGAFSISMLRFGLSTIDALTLPCSSAPAGKLGAFGGNPRQSAPPAGYSPQLPRAGKAQVATRIRLATLQKLVAVARLSDGSHWQQTVDVIVTLAARVLGRTAAENVKHPVTGDLIIADGDLIEVLDDPA